MTHQDTREAQLQADLNAAEASVVTLLAQRVQKATLAVGFADLTDSDGAQTIPFAAALPAGAVIVGMGLVVTEAFIDAGVGVFTADLGDGVVIDSMLNGADIAAIGEVSIPQGVQPSGLVGAITPAITVLADVNVDTATEGALSAEIYYVAGDAL